MIRESLRPFFAVTVLAAFLLQTITPAFASTVGTISGIVTQSDNHAAIANVQVTAASPSGSYKAITDSHGFFAITGVNPDTYTVSYQREGYEPASVGGITVAPDQVARASVTLQKSLVTIARTQTRAQTGAFQPHQPADTYTVTSAQIETIQGNTLNNSEKTLLTGLPSVSYSSGQNPTIRGGRSINVDYEFEGMDYTDPYTQNNINGFALPAFGVQSVQVSPGNEDESYGNSGVGTVNVVAKRGTYPGTVDVQAGMGAPGFFHSIDLGLGYATPNGRFSEYASYTANNSAPRYGGTYWTESANDIGVFNYPSFLQQRQVLSNTVFRFGRDNKFSLQFLINSGLNITDANYGNALTTQPLNTSCYFSCNIGQIGAFTSDQSNGFNCQTGGPPFLCQGFTGINNTTNRGLTLAQTQSLLVLWPGQTQINQFIGGRPQYSENNLYNGTKAELGWNPDSATFVNFWWSTSNGITTSDAPISALYRIVGGYNDQLNAGYTRQLSDKNLIRANVDYDSGVPINEGFFTNDELFNLSPLFQGIGELYDFISPSDPHCPLGTNAATGQSYCGHLYSVLGINPADPTGTLKLFPGAAGTRITGNAFNYSLGDTWTPNDKLTVAAGMRVEHHNYVLPPNGYLSNCTSFYVPVAYQTPSPITTVIGPNGETGAGINGKPVGPGNCPPAVFQPLTTQQQSPVVLEPRLAASLLMGVSDAVRASYGRTARFPEGEASDYAPPATYGNAVGNAAAFLNPGMHAVTGGYNCGLGAPPGGNTPYCSNLPTDYYGLHNIPTDCGFSGHLVPCTSYQEQMYWSIVNGDFANPISPLSPVTYNNWDLSYSHQFRGNWSVKVTGWTRRAYDLDIIEPLPARSFFNTTILNPNGSISFLGIKTPTNNGIEIGDGLEFYLTKENPVGWSGLWEMTYNNVRQNVPPTGADEFHGLLTTNTTGVLYRVGYVSPFTSTVAFEYTTRSGWRFQSRWDYDIGYPYGDGTITSTQYGAKTYQVPHTNVTGGGNTQFIDPANPGNIFHPNIAAILGTPEAQQAGGSLSHRNLLAELTVEKDVGHGTFGISIDNLFNQAYSGPTFPIGDFGIIEQGPFGYLNSGSYYQGGGFRLNPNYQPVASGVGGPLSGFQTNCVPSAGNNYCKTQGGNINGRGPYLNLPNAIGRSFLFYYKIHV